MGFAGIEDALNDVRQIDLTTTRRASGRKHTRPVWFVRRGGSLYLMPVSGSDSRWYRDVVETPGIRLSARGATYDATATPVTDPAGVDEVVRMFREKYGDRDVAAYFPKREVAVEVPPA
jgi:hypothetical protein